MLASRQSIEFFHLSFLRLLCVAPDKERFALKGGCNLRFFFESVRFSEDIDLDVVGIPVHTLKAKVAKILESNALRFSLQSKGIGLGTITAPKQTETTQRWKLELVIAGAAASLHTKIEFSRRATLEAAKVEPIAQSVLAEYQLMAIVAPHYPVEPALRQKVLALVGRTAVQARDVFDLAVLFSRSNSDKALAPVRRELPAAIERAMDVSYADFKSQVASYLKPGELEIQGTRAAWDALQAQVVARMERALS